MSQPEVIWITKINDDIQDFRYLFSLWDQIIGTPNAKEINFMHCSFLRPNAVAFLGGIFREAQRCSIELSINWESMTSGVLMNLMQNGFMDSIKGGIKPWKGNSVPYREDDIDSLDSSEIIDHLLINWLGEKRLKLSKKLKKAIAGTVYEIFVNAAEHSVTSIGIISCGQYFPNLKELNLTVLDFGVGIPNNVRRYFDNPNIKAGNALKWAFENGNTTDPDRIGGGNGLYLLNEFIKVNNGRMHVFSHAGIAYTNTQNTTFLNWKKNCFRGTLVNINIQCDDKYYAFWNE